MWWRLLWWVISFALSDYFRDKLPAQTASGLGDFNVPTATEGRSVPIIIGGSPKCRSLNCIWYGDFAAIERTVTTGVIFKKDEVIGFTYELALCYAAVKGEVAGIKAVWVGDDRVWDSVIDNGGVPAPSFVDIDRDDLFGGVDNGGGFIGRVRLFNGSETQGSSAFLDARVTNNPAYRGTAYIMVTSLDEATGANIGEAANLRYLTIELQAFDTVANGSLGDVMGLGNDHHFIGDDANPVSVAYDLYTNQRWGRAFAGGDVNLANFQAVAEIIWTEGLGFTQLIDEQTTTGAIQDTLEQHMDAYIGPNPITGQIEIKLARFDYVLATEYQAGASNIQGVPKWNKGDWSQTINRVRLRYSDRAKEWNETHAVAIASGNRIIQGKVVTKEIRYQGVHTAAVANLIAARDLRNLAQPTSSGTILLDRTAYQLRPGDVFSFTSINVGEDDLAVRITRAGVGNTIKNEMRFDVTADVFDSETPNVADPPASDFIPPTQTVVPFGITEQAAFEAPFILMRYDELAPNSVPRIATLAKRPLASAPTEYEVVRRTRNPPAAFAGAYASTDFVAQGFTTVGTLRNAETSWASGNGGLSMQIDPIGAESLDALIAADYTPGPGNARGIAVISPGLADEEFIIFDSIVDDLTGIRLENVWRACMDTPWEAHALGAQIWFIWTGGLGMGSEQYNIGDGVDIKLLPRSPSDAVLEASATSLPEVSMDENTGTRNSKPLLPYTATINLQIFPTTVDFDYLIVAGANAGLPGSENFPTLRDWRNQNVLGSVQGLDIAQGGFNPADVLAEALELAWWLHDLDSDPTATRANALTESVGYIAQATGTDQFDVLRSAMITGGAVGFSFNARLEIETRHSPAGQTALQVSHDVMNLDFLATGIFTVLPEAALFHAHFDGVDAAAAAPDVSQYIRRINFTTGAEIDTAQSVFGGASLKVDDTVGGVYTPYRRGFDPKADFTIECRLRFTSEATFPMIFEIWDDANDRCLQVYYQPINNTFSFNYSTTGTSLTTNVLHTGTFVPVLDTWYAFAMVKKGTTWHCYIDGTELSAAVTVAGSANIWRSSADFIIGGGGDSANFWDGHIDEFRIVPAALYVLPTYTVLTVPFGQGISAYPLLAHFDGTDTDATSISDDPNRHVITASGGTSEIDTAQSMFGVSSAFCGGNNGLTDNFGSADGWWIPGTETVAGLPNFEFAKGPFGMECFFRLAALPSSNGSEGFDLIAKYDRDFGGGAFGDWMFTLTSDTVLRFQRYLAGGTQETSDATIPLLVINTWYHAAVCRNGNNLDLFFEGIRVGQDVDFFLADPLVMNRGQKRVTIGRRASVNSLARIRAFNGWIDEVNIEKRAIYNGSTYTIPVAAKADPNDSLTIPADEYGFLWLAQGPSDGYQVDRELQSDDLRGAWLTFNGSAAMDDDVAGFGTGANTVRFDGNGDSVSFGRSQTMNMNDDDFTIEARCWFTDDPDQFGGMNIISHWYNIPNQRGFHFTIVDNAGPPHSLEFHWSTDGINDKRVFTAFTPTLAQWYHLAVVRSGTSVFLFVDGVVQTNDGASDAIGTDIIAGPGVRVWTIGHLNDNPLFYYFQGNMQNIAWTRSAKWTVGFTPPTDLLVAPTLPNF